MPRLMTAFLLAFVLLLVGRGHSMQGDEDASSWVRDRVRAVDLTMSERQWETIGWVTDVGVALELSRKSQRPIFILAAAGALDGRC